MLIYNLTIYYLQFISQFYDLQLYNELYFLKGVSTLPTCLILQNQSSVASDIRKRRLETACLILVERRYAFPIEPRPVISVNGLADSHALEGNKELM